MQKRDRATHVPGDDVISERERGSERGEGVNNGG